MDEERASEPPAGDSTPANKPYVVEAVWRACDIIEAFGSQEELLRLRDITARTGINKTTAFRTLMTLAERGFVERVGAHLYRLRLKSVRAKQFRIGYCSLSSKSSYSRDVTQSIVRAAEQENIEIHVLDNRFNPKLVLRNARILIDEKVDLVIEHQADERVIAELADLYLDANIPMIAVHVPHPGASYFGPDNYRGGLLAGRYIGKLTKLQWEGQVDQILLLEYPKAGLFPRSRLTGAVVGLKEAVPGLENTPVAVLNGYADYERSLVSVRKFLRRRKALGRTIIVGIDDPTAIGALRAFEEAGLARNCAAIGFGCSYEARAEMRRHSSRLLASVGYFPERYGEQLIPLAIRLLTNKPVPPATFVNPSLITPQNVDHYYPNDVLRSEAEITNLLLGGTVFEEKKARVR